MEMNEAIAFCGLACHECGAFLAAKNDDDEKRREVAELRSRQFSQERKKGLKTVRIATTTCAISLKSSSKWYQRRGSDWIG